MIKKDETFDLMNFDTVKGSEEGAKCYLCNPATGEEIIVGGERIWVSLKGPDSEDYIRESNKIANKRYKTARKNGDLMAEAVDQDNKSLVAKMITGWSDKLRMKGEDIPFSKDNARQIVFTYPWIYNQLNDFLGNRGNFINS